MSEQDEVRQLIDRQTPEIRELTESLRQHLRSIRPEMKEDASLKLGVIYYRHNGVVCALTAHKAHVNLHFYKGTQLSDLHGVLQGSGKKLRHLKFRELEDIQEDVIAQYVQEAYLLNEA